MCPGVLVIVCSLVLSRDGFDSGVTFISLYIVERKPCYYVGIIIELEIVYSSFFFSCCILVLRTSI